MAGRETADIVFCIDASGSMGPTFKGVRDHVLELLESLKADRQRSWDVRFDFLAFNTAFNCEGKDGMTFQTVGKKNIEVIDRLYRSPSRAPGGTSSGFFTSDVNAFRAALGSVTCQGDETTAVALDMAADFPFRDASSCHRVIILLTDEAMEDGMSVDRSESKLLELARKLQDRRIVLYMVTPQSDMYDTLSQIDKCEWTMVAGSSDGLKSVDFGKLMQSIGKSVSVSQITASASTAPKPIFNEARWTDHGDCVRTDIGNGMAFGGTINITDCKEGAPLDVSRPLDWIRAKLIWDEPVDLDLHAFVLLTNGEEHHVYFADPEDGFMALDEDQGVGGTIDDPQGNEENITCRKLKGIKRILFATMIYEERGCFSDYGGRVEVSTSNPAQPKIVVDMQSQERLDWCVIAMLDNSNPSQPWMYAVNQVVEDEPDVNSSMWHPGR